eukprot:CAMPEP_0176213978 /NCGR_PEP_ID=MMETSP0121_2-20121125/15936_1 /TAXON_ID=160619 /ORGANISM="Kryptoperidinium foliaceum, Strain CCMP 1326" /LENGTH=465 /DNA_ID=CAMNT_0017553055 /DNA_START=42 /DNA_END=1436 /DNA_ORIENTATION=+
MASLAARSGGMLPRRSQTSAASLERAIDEDGPPAVAPAAFDASRRSQTSSAIPDHHCVEHAPEDAYSAELAELKESHKKLKQAVRLRVHKAMADHNTHVATSKKFAETSLGTIAGWITAQTFYFIILRGLDPLGIDRLLESFLARLIYAVLASILVPVLDWSLSNKMSDSEHFLADQVHLVKICLPMFFAWAWKDVISAAFALAGESLLIQIATALAVTSAMVVVETLPTFRRARQAMKERGGSDSLFERMVAMLGNLALAVGFAWNTVFSRVPKHFFSLVKAPMFVFMVQVVYYVLMTTFIILIAMRLRAWKRQRHQEKQEHAEAEKAHDPERGYSQLVVHRVSSIAADAEVAGLSVVISALHFVYAWAQLDTVNALFFTYLLRCDGPGTCGYQYNFYFALIATLVFARAAAAMKLEGRLTKWNRESAALMIKAFSMNTGWAWASYCKTAITDAGTYVAFDPMW